MKHFLCLALFFLCSVLLCVSARTVEEMHAESNAIIAERREHALLTAKDGTLGYVSGVDFSSGVQTSHMACLKNAGYTFAVTRGYRSYGVVEPYLAQNVNAARAGGFKYVDVYMFPCPSCGNPAGQFRALWQAFAASKLNVGMVWLDVEGQQYYWGTQAANRQFYQGLLSAAASLGANIGLYSSQSQWSQIMGNGYNPGNMPIWYAHYDNNPSCSDWSAVAFTNRSPALKQFRGDIAVCGVGIDVSSYC